MRRGALRSVILLALAGVTTACVHERDFRSPSGRLLDNTAYALEQARESALAARYLNRKRDRRARTPVPVSSLSDETARPTRFFHNLAAKPAAPPGSR